MESVYAGNRIMGSNPIPSATYDMKILRTNIVPKLAVVCCLHGNENFGLTVWNHLSGKLEEFPGLLLILANEEAIQANSRFIDQDLSRSFPGNARGNLEERLAWEITEAVRGVRLLLDIHTTGTELRMTPIITELNPEVSRVLNVCDSKEVWAMGAAPFSLIGQVRGGASLEFGDEYSQTPEALQEVVAIITKLLGDTPDVPRVRRVYESIGTIAPDIPIPAGSNNFDHIPGVGYPFLLGEKSYQHQGFVATQYKEISI